MKEQRTSLFVKNQLPKFITDEYPNFVLFLEAYYEFLENEQYVGNVSQKNNSGILWIAFFIISAIISLIVIFSRYSRKCEKCGKWGAMIKTDKIITHKTDSRVKKTLRKTDGKGKTIQTREIYIPATKFHYDVHRKCKNCGYEDIVCETETKQN